MNNSENKIIKTKLKLINQYVLQIGGLQQVVKPRGTKKKGQHCFESLNF